MADTPRVDLNELPEPVLRAKRRGLPSAIWIVPILAIAAGVALGIRTYLGRGPTIHITFDTADGLEAGKSDVRFKNVPVGRVTSIELADDHVHINATVELTHGAAAVAVEDTRFWVERPRVGVGGISGLGTLFSGAYIGVDLGSSKQKRDHFEGLRDPPGATHDQQGRRFKLSTPDAGSLAVRSPIYLHRVSVGWISKLELAPDGKSVALEVFVEAPWDKVVTDATVFWNASGVDVAIDANGLRFDAQSVATVIAGGLAFDVRDPQQPGKPAADGATLPMFSDRAHAMTPPDGLRVTAKMRFHEAIRGVGAGTPIDLDGVHLGQVDVVSPGYDAATHTLSYTVIAAVYPERLGPAYVSLLAARPGGTPAQALATLVERGLRAQIRTGNLLTGQAYIALAFFPNAKPQPPPSTDDGPEVWILPTERGGTDQLQTQLQDIVAKIDKIPFDAIGADVHGATSAASGLLGHIDQQITPVAAKTLQDAQAAMAALQTAVQSLGTNVAAPDSAIQQSLRATLEELNRTAYQLRSLADYLEHHPESLLRGRASGPEPKGN